MQFIWSLIVGGVIGAIAGAITSRDLPAGWIGNIIAGFIGSWIGVSLFGSIGPVIGGFPIISAIIGAVILVAVVSFFTSRRA